MTQVFCCNNPRPYRPARLLHEGNFDAFLTWAENVESSPAPKSSSFFEDRDNLPAYAVQFVRQVNNGPVEAKRYFIPTPGGPGGNGVGFVEITEQDLLVGNFQKLNTYKNFKCDVHNKFFEVNMYLKDPVNQHHWRMNIARPAGDIDL